MKKLEAEHVSRQMQRAKVRAPVVLLGLIVGAGSIAAAVALHKTGQTALGVLLGVAGALAAAAWLLSAHLLAEWDRAVVLRMGRFRGTRGPGFFMIVPIIDSVARVVDMRVRTTAFYGESMLTKDTVPVNIDAIAFWHVWDGRKAILEVENYYQANVLAVQTALRDIVGIHTLAEILSERQKIAHTLQQVLEDKMQAWGMSVTSIEIRDISIPDSLKDALSKQAQAERERQSRAILGDAEREIAEKFAEAAKAYAGNPVALQLRAMNILYEGLRAGGTMMLVPSSVLDTMNLGSLAAFGAAGAPGANLPQQRAAPTDRLPVNDAPRVD